MEKDKEKIEKAIRFVDQCRRVYQNKNIEEQVDFMATASDIYKIDTWLFACSDAHWNYIKKIGTINRFIS